MLLYFSSHSILTQRVEEMMEKFDEDSDGKLTKSEYITDPYRDLDRDDISLREKEFDLVLDKNKDGIADKYYYTYLTCKELRLSIFQA